MTSKKLKITVNSIIKSMPFGHTANDEVNSTAPAQPKQLSTIELAKLARSFHAPSDVTDVAIRNFLSSLNCPRSLAVSLLYESGEHRQLVDLDVNPLHYNSAVDFRDAYLSTEFLSKANFLKLDSDRKTVAISKFRKFEDQCKATNSRFRDLSLDSLFKGANVWLLNATTRKIAEILGEFCGEELFENANWGPGVTTRLKGEHVSGTNKFHSENGITRGLYSLVGPLFAEAYPLWAKHLHRETGGEGFAFERGNSVVTVPKNAKTDRVIAIEPGINLWFQKGAGTMIRNRLRRSGVNLNTQEVNQQLARDGSVKGLLATVDFSSASDSIASHVVRELLPPMWFSVLSKLRSPVGILDKEVVKWEKFSSMGNGFTFELESLIFFAAAEAVKDYLQAEGRIYVHGDDVILPVPCLELFSAFSAFLGFTVNQEKTHAFSPFRESCGAHYFAGVNCKPIYLKERLRNVQSIYKLANRVRSTAHGLNFGYGCDSRFRSCWHYLFSRVPKPLRFCVPLTVGDAGFVVNFDEACPSRPGFGIEGYCFRGLVDTGVTQFFEGEGLSLNSLWVKPPKNHPILRGPLINFANHYREAPREHGNSYDLRGRARLRVTKMITLQWYNLGPWV